MRIGHKKFMREAMEEERKRLLQVEAENAALRAQVRELQDMLTVCISTLRSIGYLPAVGAAPIH